MPGGQQIRELIGRKRRAEIEALSLAAALALKEGQLLLCFDTFRDDPPMEAPSHADHGADDRRTAEITCDPLDE